MFGVNSVISFNEQSYRVISSQDTNVYLYNLNQGDASIKYLIVSSDELKAKLTGKELKFIDDPYEMFRLQEHNAKARARRDAAYSKIKELVCDNNILLNPGILKNKIRQLAADSNTGTKALYRLLARWFKYGMCPNALCPDYSRVGKNKTYTKAPGRVGAAGAVPPLDDKLREIFNKIIKKHVLVVDGISIARAYSHVLTEYKKLYPDSRTEPSQSQFKAFYYTNFTAKDRCKLRNSSIDYNKNVRPLVGSVYDCFQNIGECYEIDATVDDIFLLSEYDSNLTVGRPVLYTVCDSYTGMIVGFYISYQNAQYQSAAEAIYCAISNKKEYFKNNYDIDLDFEWDIEGIPGSICADNAELESKRIDNFALCHAVTISHTPPYRADMKGTVESSFSLLHKEIKELIKKAMPAKITLRKAGAKDNSKNAFLTLRQYRKIILYAIHSVNMRVRSFYPLKFNAPIRNVESFAKWASLTGRSALMRVPATLQGQLALKVSLMPRAEVSISRKGINLNGILYTCDELKRLGYFERDSSHKQCTKAVIAYDFGNISYAYVYPDPEAEPNVFYPCRLAYESRDFSGYTYYEAQQVIKNIKDGSIIARRNHDHVRSQNAQKMAQICAEAQDAQDTSPKIKGDKTDRAREINAQAREKSNNNLQNAKIYNGKSQISNVRQDKGNDTQWDDYSDDVFKAFYNK